MFYCILYLLTAISFIVTGEGCSERLNLECNAPALPEAPFGHWMVSICSAYCDTTRALCFCGEGSKYPERPVAESCGFQVKYVSFLRMGNFHIECYRNICLEADSIAIFYLFI